ncbi:MAG: DNA repair helicase [Cenarchaeum symbiont of Oopsacas minuta]|nr:DNA repair helicase [Cenarchaeum symbiont of Oopsacas minuta]
MSLHDIPLKELYRSDRDDIIAEFFVPCLANCIEYDRCVERISAKSLTTIILAIGNEPATKVRIVSGHRFGAADIALMNKIFSNNTSIVGDFIRDTKLNKLQEAVRQNRLAVKVAVSNDEEVSGMFTERVGIFTDKSGDMVAFTGTSPHTFDMQDRDFESVDVFTSWNDASRTMTKMQDFENLWENKTKYLELYDYAKAERENVLKYSSEWATDLE